MQFIFLKDYIIDIKNKKGALLIHAKEKKNQKEYQAMLI